MEAFTYKGIADGKYVEGEIEAINQEEASHKLKEQKVIITNLIRSKKKKGESKAKSKGGGFSFGKKKVKGRIISFINHRLEPSLRKECNSNFIFWGRLHYQKRLDKAINLFRKLHLINKESKFTIIGPDCGEKSKLNKLISKSRYWFFLQFRFKSTLFFSLVLQIIFILFLLK